MQIGDYYHGQSNAVYLSGSGSQVLLFKYTVAVGDSSVRLNYFGTDAIQFPTRQDALVSMYDVNTTVDATLPNAGTYNDLGETNHIQVPSAGN